MNQTFLSTEPQSEAGLPLNPTSVDSAFYATNPATGERLEIAFHRADENEVNRAAELALEAAPILAKSSGLKKAALLHRIAKGLEENAEAIKNRGHLETALPLARLTGELARTCHQLRLFAALVEEGSWVDARIDPAQPERQPAPRADIRSMHRALGPVAVFGASNFPLAFSVAGGDTAAALAAGCPVIFKAHPAHPGLSAIVGKIIDEAVREEDLPAGTFALLFDDGHLIGSELVKHSAIQAAAFTGSLNGGKALMTLAANRPEPIPVFAEMSSVNPVFVLPDAMDARAVSIAAGLHTSFTLGVGQFCTKPGVIFVPRGTSTEVFLEKLAELVKESRPGTMLTPAILGNFHRGIKKLEVVEDLRIIARSASKFHQAEAIVFVTDARNLLKHPELLEEVFGPSLVIIECDGLAEMENVARQLPGQLTATIHAIEDDLPAAVPLVDLLEARVGRVVWNGFPTGVEVGHAMVHGGPFPASSAPGSTSVGSRAIHRFTRLVCYQDVPEMLLPEALKDENPLGIRRMINGLFE